MITPKKRAYAKAREDGMNQVDSAMAAGSTKANAGANSTRWERDADVIAYRVKLRGIFPPPSGNPPDTGVGGYEIKRTVSHNGAKYKDPLKLLESIMLDPLMPPKERVAAAKELNATINAKTGESGGKKTQRADAAKKATGGKFSAAPVPIRAVK